MLGTPKALGEAVEGEAVSQRKSRGPEKPERKSEERVKELWPTREKS